MAPEVQETALKSNSAREKSTFFVKKGLQGHQNSLIDLSAVD